MKLSVLESLFVGTCWSFVLNVYEGDVTRVAEKYETISCSGFLRAFDGVAA